MANAEDTPRKFKLSWLVENYFSLYVNNEESSSPTILAENLDSSEWYIRLIPKRNKEILCYLYQISKVADKKKYFFDYECNLTNSEGDILKSEKGMHCFYEKGHCLTIDMDQFFEKFQNFSLCFTLKSEPQKLAVGCEVKTKVNVKRCAFNWNVRNNNSAWSQVKKIFHLDSSRFEINLTKSNDVYSIVISKLDKTASKNVKGKISFLNSQGVDLGTKTAMHNFKHDVWEFPNFFSISNLKAEGVKILHNEMFNLECEFSSCDHLEPDQHVQYTFDSQSTLPIVKEPFTLLDEGVPYLLSVREHWDVILQVENKHMPAHKDVLAAQSPYFTAMFEHDMLESQRGIVKTPNKDVETLQLFLNYIYLEQIEFMNYDSSIKLLVAAHEYQVLSLVEKCLKYVISSLSVNNVCEALVIADMCELEQLKVNALNFVIDNYVLIVTESEWSLWLGNNKKFAADLLSKLSLKLKNIDYDEKEKIAKEYKDSQEALFEFVSSLLKCGADPKICFEYNETLLGVVSGLGLHKITLLLLQSGARPTYHDLINSFESGDLATIETLLKHGAPVKSGSKHCESALHRLKPDKKPMSVCRLLIKYDADIDFENECYNTPLFYETIPCGGAEVIEALLFYGAKPCYKCPRGSPLEVSFYLHHSIVQKIVKYAALYINHQSDSEMYNFFQYFKREKGKSDEHLSGRQYLKFAQQCMVEINVLKSLKVNRAKSMFDLAISQGANLNSFHEDPSIFQKANEYLNKSIPIYREVLQKKLDKNNLV